MLVYQSAARTFTYRPALNIDCDAEMLVVFGAIKSGWISENFQFGGHLQIWMPNLSPEHFLFRWIVLSQGIDLASIYIGDVSQIKKLSKIKPSLGLHGEAMKWEIKQLSS